MDLVPLLIQLISGAAGGNIAGKLLKNLSLGTVLNSVVGILGGGLGGAILKMLGIGGADVAEAVEGIDLAAILQSIGGGGVGGGVLLAIIGAIKKAMAGGGSAQ